MRGSSVRTHELGGAVTSGYFFFDDFDEDLRVDFVDEDFFEDDFLPAVFFDEEVFFEDEDFFAEVDDFFEDEDFFAEDFFEDDFFAGTLPPSRLASERPMAMACLRLVTFFPEPLLSLPRFSSCMFSSTLSEAFLPYLLAIQNLLHTLVCK
jgi:hypothetical protein